VELPRQHALDGEALDPGGPVELAEGRLVGGPGRAYPRLGFLPDVCVEWEEAAAPAQEAGVRTVFARTGLVVAREGGAWGQMFPLFKTGLGGRLGNGRQYWSFVSLHDDIAALRHIIDTKSLSGPVNMTAPEPVTNREVAAAMGRVLHRPTVFAVPAPALRIALGGWRRTS
jgi:uncharacterized protein (TIGR01777 family)